MTLPATAADDGPVHAADIRHLIDARGVDLVRFARGQRKDEVTQRYLPQAAADDRGLVPAQEPASPLRTPMPEFRS